MNQKLQAKPNESRRLLALDIMRGITIAGMILVNNPGSWSNVYAPLCHAEWNGLTPTDLVFPFFMFIMGVSTYFSLRKYDFKFSWQAMLKVLRRTAVIFLIGIALAWFSSVMWGLRGGGSFSELAMNFGDVRTLGVLQRLAVSYGVGSLIGLIFSRGEIKWIVVALLVIYAFMLIIGNGYVFDSSNILVQVDRSILGESHMYTDYVDGTRMRFDPEGLLGILPSIAHMLIGFLAGGMIVNTKSNDNRIIKLFLMGTCLTFAGFLLAYGLPFNKKVWSPTFVLTTCGLASSLLALLIWVIDIKGYRRWATFFKVFGINPLFLYCLSTVLATLFDTILFPFFGQTTTAKGVIYNNVLMNVTAGNAILSSLLYAIVFVLINWAVGLILYRKNIYIKI